ncbi:MAG: glycerophosphoryl diester phosphodiesterase [Granulosicoccus sp.]|jgi:glycerophosphoryl diester phosphodiesterase
MKPLLSIILIILFSFSCGKNDLDLSQVRNLNGDKISPFGHAGMGISSQYPFNSFESISNALNIGAEGVEIDIQMTKDSVLVLFHDRTLQEQTDLEGLIYDQNWDDLKEATYKNPLFAEYKIVSLDQLFEHLKNVKDYQFFLDFKLYQPDNSDSYVSTYINAVIKTIEKHQLENNVLLSFFQQKYLEKLKLVRPNYKLVINNSFENGILLADDLNAYGIILNNDNVTKSQIEQAHEEGIRVYLFGTYSRSDNLDAIEKHPDFILTDKVKHLVKVLK